MATIDSFDRKVNDEFPETNPWSLTHNEFPQAGEGATDINVPFGCFVRPYIVKHEGSQTHLQIPKLASITRCVSCGGYINPYCEINNIRWVCPLCFTRNSFGRNMPRYRQLELSLLAELHHLVIDCPAPLFDSLSPSPVVLPQRPKSTPLTPSSLWATDRPLVHIFVVQESMPIECLQTVIEGLTAAVEHMHPEMNILLLTYSNRIGIYSLQVDTAMKPHAEGGQEDEVTVVQYVQFLSLLQTGATSTLRQGQLFEGHLHHELLGQQQSGTAGVAGQANTTGPLFPLHSVMGHDMLEASTPVGHCKSSVAKALFGVLDGCHNSQPIEGPKNLVGPTLEALVDWLTQGPELAEASTKQGPEACVAAVGTEPMADRSSTTAPYSYSLQSVMSNITGFLSGGGEDGGKDEEDGEDEWSSRGVSSRGAGTAEWPSASSANAEEPYAAFLQHTRTHAPPVQQCTGCVLHLFISQKQDLLPGSHASVCKEESASGKGATTNSSVLPGEEYLMGMDKKWTEELARKCCIQGIGINVWTMNSFEAYGSNGCDMNALSPLCELTGGKLFRTVLGQLVDMEKARFTDRLMQVLTNTPVATKCVMKLRGHCNIDLQNSIVLGPACADAEYPDVYRMGMCSPDNAIGYSLCYEPVQKSTFARHHSAINHPIVMQLAFSYETLMMSTETNEYYRHEQQRQHEEERVHKGQGDVGDQWTSASEDSSYITAALTSAGLIDQYHEAVEYIVTENQVLMDDCTEHKSHKKNRPLSERLLSLPTYGRRYSGTANSSKHDNSKRENTCVSATAAGVVYDPCKALVVVRMMRILTIQIESTAKPSRLLSHWNPSCYALLSYRMLSSQNFQDCRIQQWLHFVNGQTLALAGSHDQLHRENPFCSHLIDVVASIASATQALLSKQNKTGSSSEYSVQTIVAEIMDQSQMQGLILVFYGLQKQILQQHMTYKQQCLAKAVYGHSDAVIEVRHYLRTLDPYQCQHLMYPVLYGISSDKAVTSGDPVMPKGILSHQPIPLQRFSMITSGYSNYLLDRGNSLVVYQNVRSTVQPPSVGIPSVTPLSDTDTCTGSGGGSSSSQAPVSIPYRQDQFVVNDIIRRLSVSSPLLTPRVVCSQAGCASANELNAGLLLECDGDDQCAQLTHTTLAQFTAFIRESCISVCEGGSG